MNNFNLQLVNEVKEQFSRGLNYQEIISYIYHQLELRISLRQLHRILRSHNLFRKRNPSESRDVILFISNLIKDASASSLGYRQVHQECIRHGFVVSRNNVCTILRELDPEGVEIRKRYRLQRRKYYSLGPNWVWHIDGYDKLKPYGISIHGAIDGFSRKVLWLEVANSNKDPRTVCNYFLNVCRTIDGVPRKVVGDRGTENVHVAAVQRFLRRNHGDFLSNEKCFQYGKSITNQRIEAFWSQLRGSCTGWWMSFFKDMIEENDLDTSDKDSY